MRKGILTKVVALAMAGAMVLTPTTVLADRRPTRIDKISATSRTVRVGQEFELKVYSYGDDDDDDYYGWWSSNPDVVRRNDDDAYDDEMEFKALKPGTATITCKIRGTDIKKSCKVTVTERSTKPYIVVDDDNDVFEVEVGERDNLEARLRNATTSNRSLSYESSNPSVATVSSRGTVYGKKPGKTWITITSKADPSIKRTVRVRVEWDD